MSIHVGQRRNGLYRPTLAAAGILLLGSCSPGAFVTSPLSENTTPIINPDNFAGRKVIQAVFVNNTAFRPTFTVGVFDPDNQSTDVVFVQFAVSGATATIQLDPASTSDPVPLPCARRLTVGGAALIDLIRDRHLDADESALAAGVSFTSEPFGSPNADTDDAGSAAALNLQQGDDFICDTDADVTLTFTFEQDSSQPGGFRIDYTPPDI